MATQETKCPDNFYLPIGPKGPRGNNGADGAAGPAGGVTAGPAGPAGGSKVDINFQTGKTPYIRLPRAKTWVRLAHFIFPGTNSFTPTTWRVALGYTANGIKNIISVRLGYIQNDGTVIYVEEIQKSATNANTPTYEIISSSQLDSLPADPSNFFVEAQASIVDTTHLTILYATELR